MRDIFRLEETRGPGKVQPLSEAIGRSVQPRMKLHFNIGADANAALREIIRQYWKKTSEFILISSGVTTPDLISFVASGLVKKVITSNCSYIYPAPKPISFLQRMVKEGFLEIESWSLYSLEQRLMAAAQGVGFLPTKSLIGSSLAVENAKSFKVISNPFNSKETIGVVEALYPDISIIHGCVADHEGNTILSPPYFGSLWGARASKGGAIVTVERVVSTEFIRRHSALVKLPGYMVKYVCPVTLGAHPQGLPSDSIGVTKGYREDYDFIQDFVKASQDLSTVNTFIEEWIIQCPDHAHYLSKLGSERIRSLRQTLGAETGNESSLSPETVVSSKFNSTEMMIVAAAREIKEIVTQKGYQTILSGIGSPGLATWLAYYLLKKEDHPVDLVTGAGQFGFSPRPGDPFLITLANVMTCKMLTDTTEIYGTFVGGANTRCLSVLGTAQIDQYGNMNTVKIGGLYIIGVGGAGDAVNACETLVVAKQSKERFVKKVDFIGCPGTKVRVLVTDLGVFQKLNGEETFTVTKYFTYPSTHGKEGLMREIKERCGWDVKVGKVLKGITPPTTEELSILRYLDPKEFFIAK